MQKKNPNEKIVGIVVENNGKFQILPCKKQRNVSPYAVSAADLKGAKADDVVVIEEDAVSLKAKVTRILGNKQSPGILSLISLCEKGLSETFSAAAVKETENLTVPELGNREDLRQVPLVTIDGADSRDFDDAVFAEKTADGGFHLIVAIADVSAYVLPGSALDQEAYLRGNSTYFPDRVLPMLPEALSNGLCSLRPHEDRAVLAFHLYIDKDGNLQDQKLVRGLMNSAARLTYTQVQAAKDGQTDATTAPIMSTVIEPLYEAYAALKKAREARGAMDLDLPEQKIAMNGNSVGKVAVNARIDSQRLIEEFMVLANVAAATALEDQGAPCIYRTHSEPPSPDRVATLRAFLKTFDLELPEGEIKSGADFKDVMKQAQLLPNGDQIVRAILRVQAKAVYDTANIGHFGLALEKYAHFTSPIRRYADLFVHRSLVAAFNLGAGGLDDASINKAQETAEHITETDGISTKAARAADERLAAAYFADHIGETIEGRVSGIFKGGVFVRLGNTGADALLPIRSLGDDFYTLSEDQQSFKGRKSGETFAVGDKLSVVVTDSDAFSGSIVVANDNVKKSAPAQQKKFGPKR